MKKILYKVTCFLWFISFMVPMQSCSILGLVGGTIADNKAEKKDNTVMVEGQGWIQPEKKNQHVELLLKNKRIVIGKYKGLSQLVMHDRTYDIVTVESRKDRMKIEVADIENTRIFRERKDRSYKGFVVGLTFDIAFILIALTQDDLISIGGFSWN